MIGLFSNKMRFVISISVVVALNLLIVLLNPLRSFDAHINEYKNIPGLQQADLSSPYLTGKLIVVDISKDATDSIDSLYYQLPANLKATKAEQVKTVIWNNCVNDAVATYSNGESDFQTTCTLSIIDQAKAAMVGQKEFIGPEPTGCSHYSSGTSNCYGGKPTKDELAYLLSLPQH